MVNSHTQTEGNPANQRGCTVNMMFFDCFANMKCSQFFANAHFDSQRVVGVNAPEHELNFPTNDDKGASSSHAGGDGGKTKTDHTFRENQENRADPP